MLIKVSLLAAVVLAVALHGVHSAGTSCSGGNLPRSRQTNYWLNAIKHEETAPFNPNAAGYKVFRNVKDYGARGDGTTDDTAAINSAISQGNRCGIGCASSTVSPAIIYFPAGKYLVSKPLFQYYYTQFIGDPHNLPELIMAANFGGGLGLVSSDEYGPGGSEDWTNQDNFYRQVRNFIIDTTRAPATFAATAIHWQVAQATSITNVHMRMSKAAGNKHQGIWMENGSGGFFNDLTFDGGAFGMWVGNQQFTSRNITITNAATAIYMNWNWAWTFKNMRIDNCKLALDMSGGGTGNGTVGSVLFLDVEISNTDLAVKTVKSATSKAPGAGTLTLDNVRFTNVKTGVQHTTGTTYLAGGSKTIKLWGQGHVYQPTGSFTYQQGDLPAPDKSQVLLDNKGYFFEKTKPTYEDVALTDFVSVKAEGAKGDGRTDDTAAIQSAINKYSGCKVIFFPAGDYVVTNTVHVPVGTRIIGEIWSTILVKGANFGDLANPKVAFELGKTGDQGVIEISELIFSNSGPIPGAIVVQINAKDPANEKGAVGLWDVHFRIGGASGTLQQSAQCPKGGQPKAECMGAFLMLHIAKTGSAYLENVWAWLADHDLDGPTQVSIFSGRGILVESAEGPVWMYGTASEHSVMYQYQLSNAKNVFMGMIQTETPYYQSSPPAPKPFTVNPTYNDPDFSKCAGPTCAMAWGLRIVSSQNVYVYGAGIYNFFQNYDQGCLTTESCQENIVSVEKTNHNVNLFNLNTKAAVNMLSVDGVKRIGQIDNRSSFCSAVGLIQFK